MTLPFEEMPAAVSPVLPLEFVSLDLPERQVSPGVESDAAWRARVAELESRLAGEAEAFRQSIDAARREAEQEAQNRLEEEIGRQISQERRAVAMLTAEFARQRASYFAEVEREVIALSLAIARRVMEREAAMDPLLLRGVVRVALEKVANESSVKLHVPMKDAAAWQELLVEEGAARTVSVIGEDRMDAGEAVLETAVGRVEMGIREQLKEIERGFFDLLEKRPA